MNSEIHKSTFRRLKSESQSPSHKKRDQVHLILQSFVGKNYKAFRLQGSESQLSKVDDREFRMKYHGYQLSSEFPDRQLDKKNTQVQVQPVFCMFING